MKKINSILYASMFALTMCLLCLPALQREFKFFKTKPLSGVIEVPKLKKFNFKNYYNFSFQRSLEKNLEASFGFREPLIRLYNQYTWDFYKKTPATKVLIGKDNWLFPNWHLKAKPYSEELVAGFDKQALYLHQISNILKEYNTQVLVCFIPSKTEIYNEYLKKGTNINTEFDPVKYYCKKFDEYGINYIDLTEMFYATKDTAVFNPFPQTGTHWSNIMSVYAMDSVFKTFELLSGLNIPKLNIGEPYIGPVKKPDNDLELLLNLYRPIKQENNYYVNVDVIEDSATVHPKMITIGDSHYWNVIYNIPTKDFFSKNPYWYYANTIYFDGNYKNIDQANIAEELINSDFILLLYSAFQTYGFSSYFNESALISLCIDKDDLDSTINDITTSIKNSAEWTANLQKKADANNQTLEQAMRNDAMFMIRKDPYKYFTELNKNEIPTIRNSEIGAEIKIEKHRRQVKKVLTKEERIEEIYNNMRKSEDWMKSLKEKAEAKGKTLEEVMKNDAQWIINQEKK